MRRLLLFCVCLSGFSVLMNAQTATFSTPDTVVSYVNSAFGYFLSPVTNTGTGNLVIKWQVTASDFPSSWRDSNLSICDNKLCYTNSTSGIIWNGTTGSSFVSGPYSPGGGGDFHLVNSFTSSYVTVGTHYITVNLKDNSSSFNKNTTFIIYRPATGVGTIPKAENGISLYPNPAVSDLNVLFSADADIKNIVICNIIGQAVNVYKVTGTSARLNVDNVPAGVYFVRLINSQGNIVATRKFNKQ